MNDKLIKKVLQMLTDGKNSEAIAVKLNISKGRVAAIKAHRTMGRYSHIPVSLKKRNKKILKLHRQGMKSPEIAKQLGLKNWQQAAGIIASQTRNG